MRAFRAGSPDVELDAWAITTLEQTAELRGGRLDAGLLRLPISEPSLATQVVSRDPLLAVLPANHRLTAETTIPLAALADEPFILYKRVEGPTVQDTIVGYCMAAGFSPRIVQEAIDVQTILALVAADLGVSLLIAPTPPTGGSVAFRALVDDLPPWNMALAWSRDNQSPALARFLEVAREAGPEVLANPS